MPTRMRQLSHRCKGVSPSPANLHRVKGRMWQLRRFIAMMIVVAALAS